MRAVIETGSYLRSAERAGLSEDERGAIVDHLAAHPSDGDVMRGTGGVRKLRFAGRGFGKSGGLRVISYFAAPDVPAFPFKVYGKGDVDTISAAQRNELRAITAGIAGAYRAGAAAATPRPTKDPR